MRFYDVNPFGTNEHMESLYFRLVHIAVALKSVLMFENV